MIGALAERLSPAVTAADFVEKTDDTLTAVVDAGGDVALGEQRSASLHVRVARRGRIGWAGGRSDAPDAAVAGALASAASGPVLELMLPAPSPLPAVATAGRGTAAMGPPQLLALARGLRDRLAGRGRRIEAWAERSVGTVQVANTRGVMAEYPKALIGVGATVGGPGMPVGAPFRVHLTEVDAPAPDRLEELAAEVDRWTRWPAVDAWEPGRVTAWLYPDAVRSLLGPVLLGLSGDRWCDRSRADPFVLDGRLTLTDDPLVSDRPGSRPICDDGVPTRALDLLQRGRPRQGILDLVTAARFGRPATGHGVRIPLGAPRPGFSNLRLHPGDADDASLYRALGTGVVVIDLPWGPAPNRAPGVFRARCPWVFGVRNGEIMGRLDGAVLAGNAFELLGSVGAVGSETRWRGSWCIPSLVVDGLRLEAA